VRPSDSFWNKCSDVDKIRTLTDCYVVANKRCKADEDFRDKVRDTFAEMEDSMEKWQCESSYVTAAHRLAADLVKDGIARLTPAGVWVVDLPSGELEEYAVIRKSDHTTLYLSRELACILDRDELFHADHYLYVVDRAQRKHFEALRTILARIGREDLAEKIEHVPYGRVKGTVDEVGLQHMLSFDFRLGRTEAVNDIIAKGTELALKFMKESKTTKVSQEKEDEVARQLSLSTVVFNDMKRAKSAEYEFSFKNAFDLNHNNALLLQVRHSRLCSIESNNAELLPLLEECDSVPIETPEFDKLAKHLARLPEVIMRSAETREPCQLIVYLIDLSHCIGQVVSQAKIKGQPVDVSQ
ncbi:DALR anticodon binding domain protein, partial [Oesophagostomum dentatum]